MKDFQILSHRGWWNDAAEQNTLGAFARGFAAGVGVETDIRDAGGGLVVSHDAPVGPALPFADVVALWKERGQAGMLALNVKADGLCERVAQAMAGIDPAAYFLFDMSVPDMRHYLDAGLPVYTRHSDCEPTPAFYAAAAGVWLDALCADWATPDALRAHAQAGKRVALVSPELHGREHRRVWDNWKLWREEIHAAILLCTDFPQQAKEFFDV